MCTWDREWGQVSTPHGVVRIEQIEGTHPLPANYGTGLHPTFPFQLANTFARVFSALKSIVDEEIATSRPVSVAEAPAAFMLPDSRHPSVAVAAVTGNGLVHHPTVAICAPIFVPMYAMLSQKILALASEPVVVGVVQFPFATV